MLYLDDLEVGAVFEAGTYLVSEANIVEFARVWDPLPFHVDPEAATRSPFGGLVAAGSHIMAIRTSLLHALPRMAVLAELGWDEVRFPLPARPGDELSLRAEVLEVRPSQSKPDRGVLRSKMTVQNQHGQAVMTHVATAILARRPGG